MPARQRSQGEHVVLLVAEPAERDALIETAPDLAIVVAAPTELTRRAIDLRSRMAAWAAADAADAGAGLRAMSCRG